jgi:hypothetical protein
MNEMSDILLAEDEPAPVTVHNENGLSPFLERFPFRRTISITS